MDYGLTNIGHFMDQEIGILCLVISYERKFLILILRKGNGFYRYEGKYLFAW